jgi:hypothetical protein
LGRPSLELLQKAQFLPQLRTSSQRGDLIFWQLP